MKFRLLLLLCGLISGYAHTCLAEQPAVAPLVRGTRPNILFIAVDDLNHWVRHLGRNSQAKTPHLDRLAAMGVTFTNAHCAAPVCNPSRAAVLSGLRPGTSGVYDNNIPFVRGVNAGQSLVTQFRQAGYETLGMGKIWHGGLGFDSQWTATGGREPEKKVAVDLLDNRSIKGIQFGVLKGGDELVPDTAIADYGISELQKHHGAPFFLALGFHKPHMPWNVPQKYFDQFPLDQIELPPLQDDDLADIPAAGLRMAKPEGDHADIVQSGRWKEAIQAYLASISYLDGQVGRVLQALEDSEHRENTIICLWGDHGWHLGEKQHWRKFALWEEATRAPLIWVAPGVTKAGGVCDRAVDFMSIYPTLCELAEIPVPQHVEGRGMISLLRDPAADWDGVAVTTFGQNNHAVRSDRWRYIRYADGSQELYDHRNDPYEWTNLATREEFAGQCAELAKRLPVKNVEPAKETETPANSNRKAPRKRKNAQAVSRPAAEKRDRSAVGRSVLTATQPVVLPAASGRERPNIVWLIVEDMSADFSCYGQQDIQTPHVDQLATEGVRFSRAFVTAPICSISRSALITGRYQTSIGCQNHRSSVPGHEIQLPAPVQPVPAMMRQAGYHTNNLTADAFLRSDEQIMQNAAVTVAKTDYNFEWDSAGTYDGTHWRSRETGKPFFVQVQLSGGKLRGQGNRPQWSARALKELGSITSVDEVHLPAWLPDDPVMREDWAQYLDTVRYTDFEVGRIIQRLQEAGEWERTVLFFMTDHGISHVRCKQFLYDGGIHVPLIVRGPGISPGVVREDVVEHIDLAATTLGLAGVRKPEWMLAQDVLSEDYAPRKYVYAARDRADETVDLIRSVRDTRWKYIWNGFPTRPYLQPNQYKDSKPILQAMRRLSAAGQLTPEQALIMAETRPVEELYDLESDPNEFRNLAGDPAWSGQLRQMREALREWQRTTGDSSAPETEAVYRAEVLQSHAEGGRNTETAVYHDNVELMLRWMKERPALPGPPTD